MGSHVAADLAGKRHLAPLFFEGQQSGLLFVHGVIFGRAVKHRGCRVAPLVVQTRLHLAADVRCVRRIWRIRLVKRLPASIVKLLKPIDACAASRGMWAGV